MTVTPKKPILQNHTWIEKHSNTISHGLTSLEPEPERYCKTKGAKIQRSIFNFPSRSLEYYS